MQDAMLKKLNRYHYKRYFLVLVLFVLAFVFGKNMDVLTPEQKQSQDQIYAQQKITSGIYAVSVDQNKYELKKLFSIKSGQCGRLFFALKNLPPNDSLTNSFAENPNVQILLSNDFDQNQELGFYEIKSDRFAQNEEIDFCADSDYQNLLFEKDENSQDSSFEISDVAFYPLAIEKRDFTGLMTPIEGNTNFSNVIYQSSFSFKDANKAFKFSRKNQKIGQAFVADSDMISGADSKMEFTGTGGIGNYYLDLREIEEQNGKIRLSSDRVAYFGFNKDNAEKNLKIGGGVYHIPLAAHLEKGKTYFIGISNEGVKFNILNTLKIYGNDAGSGEKIVSSIRGKISEKPGGLYLKIYGTDYVKVADDKVLTGAKILDNGDGTGLYVYEQKGSFSDYFDLDQLITKGNSNIFYDNVQSGISAKDEDDNAFVYKINTLHPFTLAKIEAGQPGGEFTDSLVYYSFDNNNWQEIKSDRDKSTDAPLQEDKDKFQELIQGDGETKTIYIKVTYDKEDAKEKSIHLFGLKNLKISAKLKFQ